MTIGMKTPALETFRANIAHLRAFLRQHDLGEKELLRTARQVDTEISARKRAAKEREWRKRAKRFEDGAKFFYHWLAVMYVTFCETYLQDVLSYASAGDATIMRNTEQVATYEEVVLAPSIEALAEELRLRWARNFLDRGGPRAWIERLQRMGATGYPEEIGERLEELWGVRHVVVHRAGVATSDFCRRHPGFDAVPGQVLDISSELSARYLDAVRTFCQRTDEMFSARLEARRAIGA
jgi:hypothetical protein